MSYISKLLQTNNTVFTIQDIRSIWSNIPSQQTKQYIQYHIKNGNLNRVQRGVYSLPDRKINSFELGNKLRSPSYVSFETVLIQEGVIFQWSEQIRLACYEARQLNIGDYSFQYSQLKDEILLNSTGILRENNYYIASRERAFLDTLYLHPDFYFDNIRSIDFDKVWSLIDIYEQQSIIDTAKKWEAYDRSL